MSIDELLITRETFSWGTRGKNLDQDIKLILLKDIENEHLENIIKWIKKYPELYNLEILDLMETEKHYRLKVIRKQKLESLIKS